ncbi:MAG TPA: ABC transporter permease [Myxococcaceae bacterium]|nr:ABC transporter permease [Myxococcaceae bacterium]
MRSLWRSPGFTVAGALVLAVGIAASTAVFSVLRGVVLRPLGLPQPENLVRLYERPAGSEARWSWSAPDYLDLARENRAFESVAAMRADRQTLTGRGSPVQIRVARVSASFYTTLRIAPALGQAPGAEEDATGSGQTVVLMEDYWRHEFAADLGVLGRTLTLDGRVYTIGGVMPRGFQFALLREAQVLLPVAFEQIEIERRGRMPFSVVARLKPGLTVRDAQADLDVVGPEIAGRIAEHLEWRHEAQPLLEDLVGPVKPGLAALLGAVLLALLIACANVASLVLARGMARQRELAIRGALGGGRGALVLQLLAESLVLAAMGGALSLLLAPWALAGVLSLAPRDLPRLQEIHLDGWILVSAVIGAILAGLLAGLLPALQMTRPDLLSALRDGASGTPGRSRSRVALVVTEVALAFVLATGAGLMVRTLSGLLEVRTGLAAPDRVLVSDLDLPQARYPDQRIWGFAQQLVQDLSLVPGVADSALMTSVPLDSRSREEHAFDLEGSDEIPPEQTPRAEVVFATPGYLATLGVPLRSGRDIRWSDVMSAPHVVLVNEEFVRRYLGRGEPVGRRIKQILGPDNPWDIVGVFGDVRTKGLDATPVPMVLVPVLQWARPQLRVAIRAATGDPLQLLAPLRREVGMLDGDLAVSRPQVLATVLTDSMEDRRFQMTLLSLFALVALGLAGQGIYSVVSLSVAQRTREIGIRLALGADRVRLVRMVVAGGLRTALLGVVLGLGGALASTRVLSSLVYGVSTSDPLTLAGTTGLLLGAAGLASCLPAIRAARVDPAVSLRAE